MHADATSGIHTQFSFGASTSSRTTDRSDGSESVDFLPSINFDDFHSRLVPNEPDLNDFPIPGSGLYGSANNKGLSGQTVAVGTHGHEGAEGYRSEGKPSFGRDMSGNPRQMEHESVVAASRPQQGDASFIRSRRQSQFPAPMQTASGERTPRKSVGPGLLTARYEEYQRAAAPVTTAQYTSALGRRASNANRNRPGTGATTAEVGPVPSRLNTTARAFKAKSFHSEHLHPQAHLMPSPMTPDKGRSSSVSNSAATGMSPGQNNQTPHSTGRRQSVMPAHLGGLGARTISPTDARRLRRLSTLPTPATSALAPPKADQISAPGYRSATVSPLTVPEKGSTSSDPVTPEHTEQSSSLEWSLSSRSSNNSLRGTSSGMMTPRPGYPNSTSRIPTPKPRNTHSSAGRDDEDVPPVPAIPKAYGSPREPPDTPSLDSLEPQLLGTEGRAGLKILPDGSIVKLTPESDPIGSGDAFSHADGSQERGVFRHKRGLTVGSGSHPDTSPIVHNHNKKSLRPLRLPPLNLLPLSTPTATRIASLTGPSAGADRLAVTPPPPRNYTKTPSTPMTASKATFSERGRQEEYGFGGMPQLRTSSSHYSLRTDASQYARRASPPMHVGQPTPTEASRQMMTPFSSHSLPKNSGEFGFARRKSSYDLRQNDVDPDHTVVRLTGPRAQPPARKDSYSTNTANSTESETPSTGSSLRRKLSLGWRRSSSKASQRSTAAEEATPQPPKHNDMPPPRLPASASYTGSALTSPSPSTRSRPSFESWRRKSSVASVAHDSASTHKDAPSAGKTAPSNAPPPYSERPPALLRSNSITLPSAHSFLGSKSSLSAARTKSSEPRPEREDVAADEEMRKLAVKRKDFEAAAREVDELGRRATPKERVSPAQALQMVNLNIFERGEIIDYKDIYFCGTKNAKKHVGDLNSQTANFGYDDDRGDYNIVLGDHLAYRYEVVDLLGKGSFGQVVRCVDHKTGGLEAVKIIRNKKRFHQQALVEVNILQKLQEWVSIP